MTGNIHFNLQERLVWLLMFLMATCSFSWAQETNTAVTLSDSEIQVNTTTENTQQSPAVAMDSTGNYVVVWESLNTDGSGFGIYGQRFNSDGTTNGTEFLVNTTTAGNQQFPAVGMDKEGNFVVTWMDASADGSGWGIYARSYDNTGSSSGSQFVVNSEATNHQRNPRVAMSGDGAFVIVWMEAALDGSAFAIEGRLFDNTGTAAGNDFQINTSNASFHGYPDVATNLHGNFVVVWQSLGIDGSGQGIFAQQYDSTGTVVGSEFQVNSTTDDNQQAPRVAMDSTGNFVVTWTSFGQDGDAGGIYAQRFSNDGTAQGDEFQVSTTTEGSQDNADVAAMITGEFIITWNSFGQDSSFYGVYMQAYDDAADTVSSETQVNIRTEDFQQFPAIAQYYPANDAVITWQDGLRNSTETQDGDSYGIFHRHLGIELDIPPLADAGADTAICSGNAVLIGGNPTASEGLAPYTYSWEPIEGLDDATIANPTATPTGTTVYTVTVTDANNNTAQASVEVVVYALPTVTFNTVESQCIDSEALDLSGLVSPSGGTFSGTGISESSFDPAVAGVGTHTITYTYTDGNSCENSTTVDIVVNDLPTLSFAAVEPICIDTESIDLSTSVSPSGGIFSGTGISESSFDPAVAGVGTHTITYTYSGGNGCENSATVDIVVNDLPTINFASVDPICIDAESIDLSTSVSLSGGIFSGTGISGSSFDPAVAGVGTHTITYTYSDGNGCENSATVDIVVNDLPTINFATVDPICIDAESIDLSTSVSLSGGIFSGTGISGNSFDPAVAGVGNHTITYTYSDGNGCENSVTVDIVVNNLPTVTFDPVNSQCIDGNDIDLSGLVSPSGGIFSGEGISGSSFDPAVAGVGTHTITYTYTDGNSCENSATADIIVNDLPTISFAAVESICIDAEAIDLSASVSPSGGIFSGTGISESLFDPAVAGVGTHTITYTYADVNGCENSATVDIVVNDLPAVIFNSIESQCIDSEALDLSSLVSPAGGSFTGTGISGNSFDPAVAGIGTHIITYTYTDGNGCENSAAVDIIVNDLPTINFASVDPICIGAESIDLSASVSPSGGTFSGTGISGSSFDPSLADVGTHTITYTYADVNGCENSATVDIVVNDLPVVTFNPVNSQCIDGDALDLSGLVSPSGGIFSGTGISGSNFDPAVSGVGTHIITYTYTDGNGCENSATVDIVVNDLPTINFAAVDPICIDAESIDLSASVLPSGGTFSGTAISGSSFDPTVAGVGTHTITYTYSDGNDCENSATVDIVVNDLPAINFAAVGPYCMNGDAVDLSGLVTPQGGIFSGTAISGSSFDPAVAGVGPHTITYAYDDGYGCENSATVDIIVNDLPAVTFDPADLLFEGDDPADLSGLVSPTGGSFSGTGISGSSFDPTVAGVGTHTVTYTYADGNGCENSASIDIEVEAVQLRALHLNADGQSNNNTIKPYLKIDNQGDHPIPYGKITLRYWLTVENFSPMTNLSVYWAQLGTGKVNMSYVALAEPRQGALGYVEYSFDASAGEVGADSNSGPIQNGIAKQNWSSFDETDDYSYATATTYIPNQHITAYYNGLLVWGTEPPIISTVQSIKVYSQTKNPPNSNTIGTYVQVRNEGNVAVSYQDLTVRYWFTAEGEAALNFYLDYAVLGNANINGQIVRLATPVAGADSYLELSFASGLGNLNPGSSTGNIQYRMAKANWSKFDQTNDHSYLPKGPMNENSNMTVYLDGVLVYGTEPVGANARVSSSVSKVSNVPSEGFEEREEFAWKVYPNPVVEEVFVAIESAVAEEATVRVYDMMGRLLMEQQASLKVGGNQLHLAEIGRWARNTNQMVLQLQTPSLGVRQIKLLKQ